MKNLDWIKFFDLCNEVLGVGSYSMWRSENWCSWTTFDRITDDAKYWASGLPALGEYNEHGVGDGGNWGQPFQFDSIAHLIIPKKFEFRDMIEGEFMHKITEQKIDELSALLKGQEIQHYLSDWALELRLIDAHS
ncbi:hypothetical protein [Reinekea blandensis]|uniref:Uncharacterized protein n=1 Tax=Reinekea blandensis MED297 TaxID=314283 RepID=A4BF87_9GAMM|nr:hypothetical protein [Reinekea blandensis]EAR09200.1 hypothetical protein MED297_06953 [Reinekea sp. MED297] [Reinekea blandensis MED297]